MSQMRVGQQSKSHGCLAGLIAILIILLVMCWVASLSQNIVTDVYGALLCAVFVTPLVFVFIKLAKPKTMQREVSPAFPNFSKNEVVLEIPKRPGNLTVNTYPPPQPHTPKLFAPNLYEINPYERNPGTYNHIAPYGYYVQAQPAQPIKKKVPLPTASVQLIIDKKYIPTALRRAVLERDKYTCQRRGSRSFLEIDHIIPRSKGGASTSENLQVLCHGCNMQKGNR